MSTVADEVTRRARNDAPANVSSEFWYGVCPKKPKLPFGWHYIEAEDDFLMAGNASGDRFLCAGKTMHFAIRRDGKWQLTGQIVDLRNQ